MAGEGGGGVIGSRVHSPESFVRTDSLTSTQKASGSFGSRSVTSVTPEINLPKETPKASDTPLSDRTVARLPDSESPPSLSKALKYLLVLTKEKAMDKAMHAREAVLSAPSTLVKKLKGEDWKVVAEGKLEQLDGTALEGQLRTRNELIEKRQELKAMGQLNQSVVKQFEKKYGKSLELLAGDAPLPEKGKFKAPGGRKFDFGGDLSPQERRGSFEALKSAFKGSEDYQRYQKATRELTGLKEKLADMKQEIRELNADLKVTIDEHAVTEESKGRTRFDRERNEIQGDIGKARSSAQQEHVEGAKQLQDQINRMQKKIGSLRAERTSIASIKVPEKEFELKQLSKHKKQAIARLPRQELSREEFDSEVARLEQRYQYDRKLLQADIAALKQQRREIPGKIEGLEARIKKTNEQLIEHAKGKELKKELKSLDKQSKKVDEGAEKFYDRAHKRAKQERSDLKRSIRGR